ncbi:unnamed protein product [Sphagnum jensenii]|uniref:Uncharacterized protein n=1 Tax=Sphagnum jensenii TaxID=128206 RepID=A0ABP0W9Q1_9BRYO
MEFNWSLAAGDPISQPCGGGACSVNSSHNFHTPKAPCNSFESEFLETEGEVFTLGSNSFPLLPYSDSLGFTEYDPTTPSQSGTIPLANQQSVQNDEDCSLMQEELGFGVVDDTIKINNPSAVTTHCDGDINLLSFISKTVKSTVHTTSGDHDTAKDLTSSEERVQEALKASKEAKGYLLTPSIHKDKLLPDGEARIDMDLCEKWHNRKRCRVLRPNRVISEPDIPTHIVKGVEAGLPVVSSLSNSEHWLQLLDDHTNQVRCEKGNGIGAVKNHVAENEAGWHVVSGQLASACSLGQREDFKTQSCDKENNIDNKQQYLSQCNLSGRQQQFLHRLPLETCSESNTNIQIIQHKLPKKDLQSFWQGYYHHQDSSEPVVTREDMPIDGVWMCPKLHRRPQIRPKQGSLDTWLH